MVTDLQKRVAQAIVNIFETGCARGDYANVTVAEGDAGHLTYGRSQTTLASGNLHTLIAGYSSAAGALLGQQLAGYLPRLAALDLSLDNDSQLQDLLERAGQDPIMQDVQDTFFDQVYWDKAAEAAADLGITSGLGTVVVYDSFVHGSWVKIRNLTSTDHGSVGAIGERAWITHYLHERRDWMAAGAFPLSTITVFRMDALLGLVDVANWDLNLPIVIRGVTIDEAAVAPRRPRPSTLAELAEFNPALAVQMAEWQQARRVNQQDPFDYAAFRQHLLALGAPDPGPNEFKGFRDIAAIVDPAAPGRTVEITMDAVRLRETPGLVADILWEMSAGQRGVVVGGPEETGGMIWWKIDVGNQVGWAASQFLRDVAA